MNKFEYKAILILNDEDPMPKLNAEGKQGWEFIHIESDYNSKIWMKRKLEKDDELIQRLDEMVKEKVKLEQRLNNLIDEYNRLVDGKECPKFITNKTI